MHARRLVLVVVATVGAFATLLPPAPAVAGGASWISPERSAYVPSDVAVFQGRFWKGVNDVTLADRPFFAYLLPANRWIDRHVPEAAIPLGELAITRLSAYTFRARVEFRVPAVPTGLYRIDYCNDPCTVRWLGDLAGSESFAIGATRTEGRLLVQAERLRARVQEVAYRARQQAADQIRELKRDLRDAAGRESFANVRVRELAEANRATRAALEAERSTVAKASVIAGGLLLVSATLLVLLIVAIRRLRGARLDAELHAIAHEGAAADAAGLTRPSPLD